MITVDNKYLIGEVLYLRTDPDQLPRIVVAYIVDRLDVLYRVISGTTVSDHYDFELSQEKDVLINA